MFLQLTRITTPHGHEAYTWPFIPGPFRIDGSNNVLVLVTTKACPHPRTMFSSHADTADHSCEVVQHRVRDTCEGERIISTDGTTILGADCKIGMALMIKMIEAKVPGLYVFHSGEECGCIGSNELAREMEDWPELMIPLRCVAFDRRGVDSIVTHQVGKRTASDKFAEALAAQLRGTGIEMKPDDTGVFTDSQSYQHLIPECTNISVGYRNQHTTMECQDIRFAERLLERLVMVDWEGLPTERNLVEDLEPSWMKSWPKPERVLEHGKDMIICCEECGAEYLRSDAPLYCIKKGCGFPIEWDLSERDAWLREWENEI